MPAEPLPWHPPAPVYTRAQLEEQLAMYLRLEAESARTIGYHDAHRRGLVGSQEAYKRLREEVEAQLAALDTPPES
jgi:hypothetical protein